MRAGVKYLELSSVCTSITDGSHFSPKEDPEGLIPMLSVKDMAADGFDYSSCKYISESDYQTLVANGCRPSVGDVLVAKDGSYLKTAFVQKEDKEQAILSSIAILTPRTDLVLPEYLALFFKAPHTKATVEKHYLTGTAIKRVILKGFKVIKAPVPSLSEQKRIVAELDLLQGIIDKQKAQLKELDAFAQAIFCDMFLHEDGQVVKLHDVCSIVSGLVNPNEEPYCNYPHIGGANIESGTGVFINVKLAKEENLISGKYLFDDTMILYSKIRPNLNKVALPSFVGICSADMYPIIPDRDIIDRTFLKFVLTQSDFLEYAVSHSGRANIPKINRDDLMEYSFMTYSLPLQQAFATKIEAIEHQKASINAAIAETQKLFDYTMDKYFG